MGLMERDLDLKRLGNFKLTASWRASVYTLVYIYIINLFSAGGLYKHASSSESSK